MIKLSPFWFSSIFGYVRAENSSDVDKYHCETLEDFEKIAWEVVKPQYDDWLKKGDRDLRSKAFYLNGRATFYYVMMFGSENEKLEYYSRYEDIIIDMPSKHARQLFMNDFYPTIWNIVFTGQEKYVPQKKEDYEIVDGVLDMGVWPNR